MAYIRKNPLNNNGKRRKDCKATRDANKANGYKVLVRAELTNKNFTICPTMENTYKNPDPYKDIYNQCDDKVDTRDTNILIALRDIYALSPIRLILIMESLIGTKTSVYNLEKVFQKLSNDLDLSTNQIHSHIKKIKEDVMLKNFWRTPHHRGRTAKTT